MSKENAEKFLDDVNSNAGLKQKLLDAAASAQAWIAEAASAGYQMTVDELRSAAEAVVGKPVSGDQLIGTLRGLFEGELKDDSLDAVTGGAGVPQRALKINTQVAKVAAQTPGGTHMGPNDFAREGGPIKVGFDPGGSHSQGGH
jgi:predicted ribosomally synthesized peptide with nif11-like leader